MVPSPYAIRSWAGRALVDSPPAGGYFAWGGRISSHVRIRKWSRGLWGSEVGMGAFTISHHRKLTPRSSPPSKKTPFPLEGAAPHSAAVAPQRRICEREANFPIRRVCRGSLRDMGGGPQFAIQWREANWRAALAVAC